MVTFVIKEWGIGSLEAQPYVCPAHVSSSLCQWQVPPGEIQMLFTLTAWAAACNKDTGWNVWGWVQSVCTQGSPFLLAALETCKKLYSQKEQPLLALQMVLAWSTAFSDALQNSIQFMLGSQGLWKELLWWGLSCEEAYLLRREGDCSPLSGLMEKAFIWFSFYLGASKRSVGKHGRPWRPSPDSFCRLIIYLRPNLWF